MNPTITSTDPPETNQKVKEIHLPGQKLESETQNLDVINRIGSALFEDNRNFIIEKIPDNWYAVIEPTSATLIASEDISELYDYTTKNHPNKLLFVIGLLRNSFNRYAFAVR